MENVKTSCDEDAKSTTTQAMAAAALNTANAPNLAFSLCIRFV